MLYSVQSILDILDSAPPGLYLAFSCLTPLFATRTEARSVTQLYESLEEINFSHQVLAQLPQRLAVLKVSGVSWSDLGEPKRVTASLDMVGIRPHWVDSASPQFA